MNSPPSPNWRQLHHAYGPATDIPDLLADIRDNPYSEAWGELWGSVCHQGTTYSASPHVLPYLLDFVTLWPPHQHPQPLALAADIAIAKETDLTGFEDCVRELRDIALDTLSNPGLDQSDRIHVIQAILALEGDRPWGLHFERLHDGEFTGWCPQCKAGLYFVIGAYGLFCSSGDYVRDDNVIRVPITPAAQESLNPTARKLYDLGTLSKDTDLPTWICHLFGTTYCPECGTQLDIAANLTKI